MQRYTSLYHKSNVPYEIKKYVVKYSKGKFCCEMYGCAARLLLDLIQCFAIPIIAGIVSTSSNDGSRLCPHL